MANACKYLFLIVLRHVMAFGSWGLEYQNYTKHMGFRLSSDSRAVTRIEKRYQNRGFVARGGNMQCL